MAARRRQREDLGYLGGEREIDLVVNPERPELLVNVALSVGRSDTRMRPNHNPQPLLTITVQRIRRSTPGNQVIEQPLDLGTLAAVAHFSPFHFHRLFSAWMGETLGDYLRRRKIEVAAMRLVAQPRVPVLHIALSVGFGSAEAFARAFRARFGFSPTSWRVQQAERRFANSNPGEAWTALLRDWLPLAFRPPPTMNAREAIA
jgi:AraC-like DNA-binding protein